jgi:hypothetical protein
MSILTFRKIPNDIPSEFSCGNHSIDEKLHEHAYFQQILRQSYTYQIEADNKVIGYYMLQFFPLDLAACPDYASDVYDTEDVVYYAIKLEVIAIDCRLQGNGLGTFVLKDKILPDALALSERYPIRFIIIDALQERIHWYESIGFQSISNNSENLPTVLMFMDLVDQEELYSYTESLR